MESNAILETVNSIIFGSHGVWFLIGAALVYFMQAGFAMCEAGFTRAKNVGNIIMKNLMDFCLGTVAFIFVGYNILCGDASKFWGGFTMNPFDFGSMDCYGFVFTLFSVQLLQQSFPVQWLNVLNSLLIVFTVLSSVCLSIQSKHTGYGAAQHG